VVFAWLRIEMTNCFSFNLIGQKKMDKPTQLLRLDEKLTKKKTPIHIVTSTFLNSSRYHNFFFIWSYLGLLSLFQWIQYLYVKEKSVTWSESLSNWLKRLKYLENQKDFKWISFKQDFLPHSIVKHFI
jgi:hypothetical protein